MTEYPTEYRGNTIYDEKQAKELENGKYTLISGTHEVQHVLDSIGVSHDPESIIAEDSYSSLLVETWEGEYTEVWGFHSNTVHLKDWGVRLK